MKVIAITEIHSWDRSPKKMLVEMSGEEFELLNGTRLKGEVKIGTTFDVAKYWNNMVTLRRAYNERDQVTDHFKKLCDDLKAVELPKFEEMSLNSQ